MDPRSAAVTAPVAASVTASVTGPVAPVTVEVNGTAALLLIKLMQDLGTDQPMAALSRALGLLDQALAAKRQGYRLGAYDPESQRFMDLVI